MFKTRKDLTGQTFGKLKVIGYAETRNKRAYWLCECACGKQVVKMGKYLTDGDTSSCGCFHKEQLSERQRTHGESVDNTPEYRTWRHMKDRCYNKNNSKYPRYGGRGITVCERWKDSYLNFIEDMGRKPSPDHSIDRINNDGNYEPENCRWATTQQQGTNKTRGGGWHTHKKRGR